MVKTFHIAAQYLATVAISFLEPKDDDSHTNLGWRNGALQTHSLSESNCICSLDYRSFSLIWTNDLSYKESFSLDGKTHSEIVHWIRKTSLKAKHKKVYEYALHYELPYEKIKSDFIFQKPSNKETDELIAQRDIVQKALENVLKRKNQNTSIRIWPHHFDSDSFFMANDEIGIGLEMAIPDRMIDDFYFYVSGYKRHDGIELSSAIELEKGDYYYNNEWKGIALAASGVAADEATEFYEQSINHYLN